jgi:hypothetical protein
LKSKYEFEEKILQEDFLLDNQRIELQGFGGLLYFLYVLHLLLALIEQEVYKLEIKDEELDEL